MSAILDETRTYRYRLVRPKTCAWPIPPTLWVMLNPSTADEVRNDPTIRKCRGFQAVWAAGERGAACEVVNLFALRATDPAELPKHPDPVGPDNDSHIAGAALDVLSGGGKVVFAWGANRFARERAAIVTASLAELGQPVYCLGTTKDGSPRHPLYVPYSQPLVPWEGYR